MMERLENLLHGLKHPPIIMISTKEWRRRKTLIKILGQEGYRIDGDAPNPTRLYAYKDSEEFIIDIFEENVNATSIKWVSEDTTEPILVTDIPSTGRYGVLNRESKLASEMESIVERLEAKV